MDHDVLVVGAGPTGLTAGIELLRRGVSVRLVDRVRHGSPHSKAVVLWPRALEVFARMGAEERIRELAVPITAANYHTGSRRVARINYRRMPGSRFDTPLALPQNQTEAVLRAVWQDLGGEVEYGIRLEGLEQDRDAVSARLTDGTDRASWVVGADGAHSAVRSAIGVDFEGATYSQSFVLVDGHWETPLPHLESHYFMTAKGVLVVVGLPNGVVRVFAGAPAGTPSDLAPEDVVDLVAGLAAERCPQPLRLVEATGSGLFHVHRRMAGRLRVDRVLLAGDAAHVHSPAGGQGLNTCIQDAHELAWRLADILRGRLDEGQLGAWERERAHVAHHVLADTDRQTRLWTAKGWRATARDALSLVAGAAGVLDRVLPPRQAQLSLAYPALEDGQDGLLGRRLPDLPLPSGGRLQDVLGFGRHVLIVLEQIRAPSQEDAALPGFLSGEWLARYQAVPVDFEALPTSTSGGVERVAPDAGPLVVRFAGPVPGDLRGLGLRSPGAVLVRPDGVISAAGVFTDSDLRRRMEAALPLPAAGALLEIHRTDSPAGTLSCPEKGEPDDH